MVGTEVLHRVRLCAAGRAYNHAAHGFRLLHEQRADPAGGGGDQDRVVAGDAHRGQQPVGESAGLEHSQRGAGRQIVRQRKRPGGICHRVFGIAAGEPDGGCHDPLPLQRRVHTWPESDDSAADLDARNPRQRKWIAA